MDVTHGEEVEAHLEAFISKRDQQRRKSEGERPREESYEQNLREHAAERRLSVLYQRRDFALAQIERHQPKLRGAGGPPLGGPRAGGGRDR